MTEWLKGQGLANEIFSGMVFELALNPALDAVFASIDLGNKEHTDVAKEKFKESLREAFAKQVEKKPKCENRPPVRSYYCPNCGKQLERKEYVCGTYDIEEINYCKWCGQALDWSE